MKEEVAIYMKTEGFDQNTCLQLLRDMETNGNDNGREGRSCDKSLSDDTLLRMMENLGVPPER